MKTIILYDRPEISVITFFALYTRYYFLSNSVMRRDTWRIYIVIKIGT